MRALPPPHITGDPYPLDFEADPGSRRVNVTEIRLPRTSPPFRAEHIGSLLRPQPLLDARAGFARGAIGPEALAEAQDAAIEQAITLQQRTGFRFVTDGEFRRRSYHSYFYQQLGDVSIDTIAGAPAPGAEGGTSRGSQPVAVVNSRVRWTHPINAAGRRCRRDRGGLPRRRCVLG
jgi:hypothetical protein